MNEILSYNTLFITAGWHGPHLRSAGCVGPRGGLAEWVGTIYRRLFPSRGNVLHRGAGGGVASALSTRNLGFRGVHHRGGCITVAGGLVT